MFHFTRLSVKLHIPPHYALTIKAYLFRCTRRRVLQYFYLHGVYHAGRGLLTWRENT